MTTNKAWAGIQTQSYAKIRLTLEDGIRKDFMKVLTTKLTLE